MTSLPDSVRAGPAAADDAGAEDGDDDGDDAAAADLDDRAAPTPQGRPTSASAGSARSTRVRKQSRCARPPVTEAAASSNGARGT